jgi:hypothetical protein
VHERLPHSLLNWVCLVEQDTVAARTPDGRRLRRRLLKGVVVVFVVAGYQGKRFIYERAKALGVRCAPFPQSP